MEMTAREAAAHVYAPQSIAEEFDVAVVVVNYNHGELLYKCVESIVELSDQPSEVLIVDNASAEPPVDLAYQYDANVKVIANSRNIGFARAVNQAILQTQSKYVLLLNPDASVKPGAVRELTRFMENNPDVGLAGCKLLYPDGTLQWSCRTFYNPVTILFRRSPLGKLWPDNPVSRKHLMVDLDHNVPMEVDWVLGASMMVRREAIEDVGLLDENFFLYFEDVDWCYRMKQHGWKVWYYPHAEMVHHHQRASLGFNKTALYHVRSMVYYYRKHFLSKLFPNRWQADHRADALKRLLRIYKISWWRKSVVIGRCRISGAASFVTKFAHRLSRGKSPDLTPLDQGSFEAVTRATYAGNERDCQSNESFGS